MIYAFVFLRFEKQAQKFIFLNYETKSAMAKLIYLHCNYSEELKAEWFLRRERKTYVKDFRYKGPTSKLQNPLPRWLDDFYRSEYPRDKDIEGN